MIIAVYLLSFLTLILNASLFVHLKPPYNFHFWAFQIAAVVLSPFLVVLGLLGAGLGWLYHAPIAVAAGVLGAGISILYIARVTVPQPGFNLAFGKDWKTRIQPSQASHMLKRRWNLGWPQTVEPRWERDIPFWTISGTDRKLLCDIWQPPESATRELQRKLVESGVPSVLIIYPLANHAFDLILPKVSPPAHAALYYLERFQALALEAGSFERTDK